MTTTETRRSPAAPAIVSLVLLAAILLFAAFAPAFADDQATDSGATPAQAMVPEPATLIFVGITGLALFHRSGKQRLR
jgi:hypothetical protein